jgi:hypothetical protein
MSDFKQVVAWPATLVGATNIDDFELFMLEELGSRVKYIEEVKTLPDMKDGVPVEGTGDRNDLFFYVHSDDIVKFAIARLPYGMRWIEDVYGNGDGGLYPERISEYRTW